MDFIILGVVAIFGGIIVDHLVRLRRHQADIKAMVGTIKAQVARNSNLVSEIKVDLDKARSLLRTIDKSFDLIPATRVGTTPAPKSERDLFEAGEWLAWYALKATPGIEEKGPPIGEALIEIVQRNGSKMTARADYLDWSDIGASSIRGYRRATLDAGKDWADTLAAEIEEFAAQKDETPLR